MHGVRGRDDVNRLTDEGARLRRVLNPERWNAFVESGAQTTHRPTAALEKTSQCHPSWPCRSNEGWKSGGDSRARAFRRGTEPPAVVLRGANQGQDAP